MTPEEAYTEALRRIREAEETETSALDLSSLDSLRQLPQDLERLNGLRVLDLSLCSELRELAPLVSLTALQVLKVRGCYRFQDLRALAELRSLRKLDLSGCVQVIDLGVLDQLSSLQELKLAECGRLRDLTPLARLSSLQRLSLARCKQLSDFSPLARLTLLQRLSLAECEQLGDLGMLVELSSLQELNLAGCEQLSDFSPLARLSSLQALNLARCYEISNLCALAELNSLRGLDLFGCYRLRDLSPLARLSSLRRLSLFGCYRLRDLSPLAQLSALKRLRLRGCEQLSNFSALSRLSSLEELDLAQCYELEDLMPLIGLTFLQGLDLSGCKKLSDLTPLTPLLSLQRLSLSGCERLDDFTPLAQLASLQRLGLDGCIGVRPFAPLLPLLPSLQELTLFGCQFDDLPAEVHGEKPNENVADKVRAHFADLGFGERRDAEVKVFLLGNGGVGKSQLCRRLRGEGFDSSVASTHGIQLSDVAVELEGLEDTVRLNLWDFGGQDIYHGSHTLFLQGQAIFLILWTPKLEEGSGPEGDLTFRNRPLAYWLDYLRAFVRVDSPVLLIQSQCDTPDRRAPFSQVDPGDFTTLQRVQVSAKTGLGLDLVKAALKEAVRDCVHRRPPPSIGAGRAAVRDRLRKMLSEEQALPTTQRQHRLLDRDEFNRLCDETGGVSDKDALLDFLHHSGVVFYRAGLFDDRIVLDQNWALEAIYALFDRKKTLPLLRGYGRFTREDLEALIWTGYTPEEQNVFLGIMESCGICFPAQRVSVNEWEYLAPELLPEWSDAQDLLLGRLREEPAAAEAEARYAFLHEGILRGYLSKIGEHAQGAPVYWKYGCWFYERTTKSQVLIESCWKDAAETGQGTIRFRGWGERAQQLIKPLLAELQKLPVGQPPEIIWQRGKAAQGPLSRTGDVDRTGETGLEDLQIPARPDLPDKGQPEVFVSFAWGDDSSEDARRRTEIVDCLCETLTEKGWTILRDSRALRPGELISGFMKRIGLADHVIVVLSDKYLHSTYCMTELHAIYQRALGEKEDFCDASSP